MKTLLLIGSVLLAEAADPIPARIVDAVSVDVDGNVVRLGRDERMRAVALVFVDVGCPIAKRYAPRLNEIAALATERGVSFYGVLSDPDVGFARGRQYRDEFALKFPLLLDTSGELASRLQPTHVPEAFVVTSSDALAYRGRIDDWFAAPGKPRATVTSHDFADAITAVATGNEPKNARTEPVGCEFEGWDDTPPDDVNWARHVAPILNAHCVECHREGEIGPFALDTYKRARRRAKMIARVVEDGQMPPWHAREGHGAFRDARVLGAREKAILRAWAKAKAPQGDADDAPPPPPAPAGGWALGKPDLELVMPEPFDVPASGEDIYRYFVVPLELAESVGVVAFDFQPGDPAVVHHCIAYVDYSGWARKMDAKDPAPGFTVFGNTEGLLSGVGDNNVGGIGGWAPGARPYRLPDGHGMRLEAGGDVILEVHYHLTGKATKDQSRAALYFAKKPIEHWVEGIVIGTNRLDIDAGDEGYWRHVQMKVPAAFDLLDIGPHMHFIGEEVEVMATLPDGTQKPLLAVDWDFRWQGVYVYREPVHIPKGTTIDAWFRFDNSADNPDNPNSPPKTIQWGWQTTDEMCELYLTIVPKRARDFARIEMASLASWMRSARPKTAAPPWR